MKNIDSDIMVSVNCLVYNHAPYLRQCLEGFIMQKTSFRFEVILHDDVSTDGSVEIIKEYAEKYPDIIKPIYEKENQYSKKDGSIARIMINNMSGKYVAMCEGDDYWIDPLKLQKQFDMMEKHPEIDMCTHATYFEDAVSGMRCGENFHGKDVCVLSTQDVILEEGGFITTSSIFYRNTLNQKIPAFREFMDYDYPLQIQGSLRGGILYLPDYMSVYHQGVPGSFCNREKTIEEKVDYIHNKEHLLSLLDEETNHLYHNTIIARFLLYEVTSQNNQIKNIRILWKYRKGWPKLDCKKKINIIRKCICPQFILLYNRYFRK